jgi:aspartate racemase
MKTLGLIGGVSWISTIEYYRMINEGVNRRLGGAHYAKCVIHSFNYAEIQALNATQDWDGVLRMVMSACEGLHRAGADGIVLCANTMHLIAERLQKRIGLPVIHIADATAAAIERAGLDRVGLLGTRFTMEMDFFTGRLAARGIQVDIPGEADRAFIHQTIFSELGKGVFLAETKARYLACVSSLTALGAGGVVLGCTEIPLLLQHEDCSVPVFDTTAIHAAAAVEFALSE